MSRHKKIHQHALKSNKLLCFITAKEKEKKCILLLLFMVVKICYWTKAWFYWRWERSPWRMAMRKRGVQGGQMRKCRDEASVQIIVRKAKGPLALYTAIFFVCFVSITALGWPFTKGLNGLFDRHCHEAFDFGQLRNEWIMCSSQGLHGMMQGQRSYSDFIQYVSSFVTFTSKLKCRQSQVWKVGRHCLKSFRSKKYGVKISKIVASSRIIYFYPLATCCMEDCLWFLGNLLC